MLFCSLCCMHKYEMVIIPLIIVLTYLLQIGVLFLSTANAVCEGSCLPNELSLLVILYFNLVLFTSCKMYCKLYLLRCIIGYLKPTYYWVPPTSSLEDPISPSEELRCRTKFSHDWHPTSVSKQSWALQRETQAVLIVH